MELEKYLIVNADDFGRSAGINRGIIQAHEQGIVTSASLMVRWPAAAEAAEYARAHPRFSVGLHLDLGEWVYRDEAWQPAYEVVSLDQVEEVAAEINRQLETFLQRLGRNPTHFDSHQHFHRAEPVRSLLQQQANRLGVVLRDIHPAVHYRGDFYGQSNKGDPYPEGISIAGLVNILHHLPLGVTELGCHPGEGTDPDSTYNRERRIECETLCNPQLRSALQSEGITLCSFLNRPNMV